MIIINKCNGINFTLWNCFTLYLCIFCPENNGWDRFCKKKKKNYPKEGVIKIIVEKL